MESARQPRGCEQINDERIGSLREDPQDSFLHRINDIEHAGSHPGREWIEGNTYRCRESAFVAIHPSHNPLTPPPATVEMILVVTTFCASAISGNGPMPSVPLCERDY
jgi:hypothetical protein